ADETDRSIPQAELGAARVVAGEGEGCHSPRKKSLGSWEQTVKPLRPIDLDISAGEHTRRRKTVRIIRAVGPPGAQPFELHVVRFARQKRVGQPVRGIPWSILRIQPEQAVVVNRRSP